MAMGGVIPRPLVQQKPTLYLKYSCFLLDCEAFKSSLSTPKVYTLPCLE